MWVFDTVPLAFELATWLAHVLHELEIPASLRNRIAASCFAVTQEHQHAVVVCLKQAPPLHASAFALVRIQYEAYVRGMWLSHCASEEQVEAFSKGVEPPKILQMIKEIDLASAVGAQLLVTLHNNNWKAMCAYAHTGAQQVQRWLTSNAIEPNYDPNEVREVLSFTSAISLLSAVSVAWLAGEDGLARKILEKYEISLE